MVALNFTTQGVAPNAALEPVPSGIYDVVITASTEEPTKAGTGSFIKFEFTVQNHTDRSLIGRKLYDRLNIRNPNQQSVDIAYGTLSAICHVVNRHNIQDTQQLHGIPLKVVVAKVARDDKPGEFSNDVKGYKDVNGNDPGAGGGQAPNTGAGGQQYPDPAHSPNQGQNQQQGNQGQQQGNNQGGGNGPSFAQGNGQTQGPGAGQQNYGNNGQQNNGQAQGQNNGQQGNQPPAWAGGGQNQGNQPQQGQNNGNDGQAQNQQGNQNQQAGNQGNGGGQAFVPGSAPPWAGGQNQGQ